MDNASGQEDAEAEDMEMESEEAAEEAAMEDEQVAAETAVAERTDTAGKDYTGGVWYKIRWGDTLWELADSFYDDPWKYPEIAKKNSIPDPDKIYTGHDLFIPEKTK
ncbi:MAG: LysM peptidoglycan-binding domain-containing protein [Spirochaetales bacterium]|nr:LysM peptidoglycan-binding domain-containing protein [Spirochaetales bacterium]